MNSIFSTIALAALLFASAGPACAEELGLLLIEVHVQWVDDIDNDPGPAADAWTNAYWVKNLATGKSYGGLVEPHGVEMLEVPEGYYCVDTVRTGNNVHLNLSYCGEPYFRVVGGRLNNAGRWRFGYRGKTRDFKLFSSAESADRVLSRAKRFFPERFNPEIK